MYERKGGKAIAILRGGYRRRNGKGIRQANVFLCDIWKHVLSTYMLDVSLLVVETVVRLEGGAWSVVE